MKQNKHVFGMIIALLFSLFGIAMSLHLIVHCGLLLVPIVELVIYLCLCYYVTKGYKKPHGNGLRYIMFIFAICLTAYAYWEALSEFYYGMILYAFVAINVAYISGRLDKVKKNRWIVLWNYVLLLLVGTLSVLQLIAFSIEIGTASHIEIVHFIFMYSPFILYFVINFIYAIRWGQHKTIGLLDKVAKTIYAPKEVKAARAAATANTVQAARAYHHATQLKEAKKLAKENTTSEIRRTVKKNRRKAAKQIKKNAPKQVKKNVKQAKKNAPKQVKKVAKAAKKTIRR